MSTSTSNPDYLGFYINLDRSVQRRAWFEAQLARWDQSQRYRRFSAVDGNLLPAGNSPLRPQETGCFLSHYAVLREHLDRGAHLHVMEDDALFCGRTGGVLGSLLSSAAIDSFDIIFTDIIIPVEVGPIREFKLLFDEIVARHGPVEAESFNGFTVVDLKTKWFVGAASYLVHRNALPRLHALYAAELQAGLKAPLDLFLRNLILSNTLRGGCVFPFITSVELAETVETTITNRTVDQRSQLATNIMRQSFFVGRDLDRCRRMLAEIHQPKALDAHQRLIADLVDYKLFGDWKMF